MARIQELPDDVDERLDLKKQTTSTTQRQPQAPAASTPDLVDQVLSAPSPFPSSKTSGSSSPGHDAISTPPGTAGAAMPPAMSSIRQYSADEVVNMLNRTPLFMTTLDETDGQGGSNIELEALRALAYEGTRAEVAQNFREQGNDMAKSRNWADARGYYDQALAALRNPNTKPQDAEAGGPDMELVAVEDEEEKAKKERAIEEACWVNRALCNLELKNYRACTLDCAAALRLNPDNTKAWYRSASACLLLSKIPEAGDACARGLDIEPSNAALKALAAKIAGRQSEIEAATRRRKERDERAAAETANLKLALKARGIRTRMTDKAPDTEDAALRLEDPLDAKSTLVVPVILLYPLHAQSDFIKAFAEGQSLNDHLLANILPLPWDEANEYTPEVECYVESASGGGALIKAGKKMALGRILASGKVEIVDGLLSVYVLPKARADGWVGEWKARQPRRT